MSVYICYCITLLSEKNKISEIIYALGNFFSFKARIMEEYPQHLLLCLTACLRDLGNSKCVHKFVNEDTYYGDCLNNGF